MKLLQLGACDTVPYRNPNQKQRRNSNKKRSTEFISVLRTTLPYRFTTSQMSQALPGRPIYNADFGNDWSAQRTQLPHKFNPTQRSRTTAHLRWPQLEPADARQTQIASTPACWRQSCTQCAAPTRLGFRKRSFERPRQLVGGTRIVMRGYWKKRKSSQPSCQLATSNKPSVRA